MASDADAKPTERAETLSEIRLTSDTREAWATETIETALDTTSTAALTLFLADCNSAEVTLPAPAATVLQTHAKSPAPLFCRTAPADPPRSVLNNCENTEIARECSEIRCESALTCTDSCALTAEIALESALSALIRLLISAETATLTMLAALLAALAIESADAALTETMETALETIEIALAAAALTAESSLEVTLPAPPPPTDALIHWADTLLHARAWRDVGVPDNETPACSPIDCVERACDIALTCSDNCWLTAEIALESTLSALVRLLISFDNACDTIDAALEAAFATLSALDAALLTTEIA